MTGYYLITTDNWFIAPDGKEYKAVWGNVEILNDTFLGIQTNRNATNWYAKVGTEDNHVIVAGCQIHYAVKSKEKPFTDFSECWTSSEKGCTNFIAPNKIYIAE